MTSKRSSGPDDLVRRIADVLPEGLSQLNADVRKNIKEVVAASLTRMDLVSREEFEVQAAVLARTREKLERLEAQVAALEQRRRGDEGGAGS